jgi:competence protein ComEC
VRAGWILDDALPRELEGQDLVIAGHIADIPQETGFGARFLFDVESAWRADTPVTIPARISLSGRPQGTTPRAGERWRLAVRLTRPHGFQNSGGFDYEGYLFRNRIRARGYVRDWVAVLPDPSGRYAIDRVRERIGERIRAALDDSPQAGIVEALANGHARGIQPGQWDVLRATGTLHLVAISGLHISLIGGIAFFIARFLWSLPGYTVLRLPAPVAGAIGALLAATAYAALAGFVVPAQRALIMLAVAMLGVLLRRRYLPSELLAAALLAVLVFDPLAVMASGFWLSFAAVAVILFVAHDPARPLWRRVGFIQVAIALGLAPLTLWMFQQVSLTGPLANLLAIPVFDFAVVPLVLAGIVSLGLGIETFTVWLFQAAAWLLDQLWPALEWLAQLSWSQWWQPPPGVVALGCAAVGLLILFAPRGWPARWVGVVWLLPLVAVEPNTLASGEVRFTVLDVGQGLAAVVRTANHTLVYDTGPRFSASFDTGESVVAPYLRQAGVRQIDALVISHGDNDHAGGADSVRQAMTVSRLLSSVPALEGIAEPCTEGARWQWDGVEFELFNPPPGVTSSHNNASCVLRVRGPHGAILLPGDIEAKAEKRLVSRYGDGLRADVLVAPHHGSKTSSSPAFIAAVRPRHVIYAAGYRSRHGHPHAQVTERYDRHVARSHASPERGAVEFELTERGIFWSAWREREHRYWFAN